MLGFMEGSGGFIWWNRNGITGVDLDVAYACYI